MSCRPIASGLRRALAAAISFDYVASSLTLVGCQATPRSAADFQGRAQPPITRPQAIELLASLPAGSRVLGSVSASCSATETTGDWRNRWLSDVDCTTERLTSALMERAAEVGGALLVGTRCRARALRQGDRLVTCSAEVARPGQEPSAAEPGAAESSEAEQVQYPASEAWNILVDFTLAASDHERPSRPIGEVAEAPEVPVSHLILGQVVTRCERGCSERGAHAGLVAAAARRGATTLALASCRRHLEGWLCVGTAAAYQVDPQNHPQAR